MRTRFDIALGKPVPKPKRKRITKHPEAEGIDLDFLLDQSIKSELNLIKRKKRKSVKDEHGYDLDLDRILSEVDI